MLGAFQVTNLVDPKGDDRIEQLTVDWEDVSDTDRSSNSVTMTDEEITDQDELGLDDISLNQDCDHLAETTLDKADLELLASQMGLSFSTAGCDSDDIRHLNKRVERYHDLGKVSHIAMQAGNILNPAYYISKEIIRYKEVATEQSEKRLDEGMSQDNVY